MKTTKEQAEKIWHEADGVLLRECLVAIDGSGDPAIERFLALSAEMMAECYPEEPTLDMLEGLEKRITALEVALRAVLTTAGVLNESVCNLKGTL